MNFKDYLFEYTMMLADNSLILGHRVSEWSGKGPFLEEDIALTNIALDHIGQSRLFYEYASELEGRGRTEDDYAFNRDSSEFRNITLVEHTNDNFAYTMARQFLFDCYQLLLYEELKSSSDSVLAAIAEKSYKETLFHIRHSSEWILRMGLGTSEGSIRIQQALNDLWTYTEEMFDTFDEDAALAEHGIIPAPEALKKRWYERVAETLKDARLKIPANDERLRLCGRKGFHTEKLGYLLAEMQFLPRAYPGTKW